MRMNSLKSRAMNCGPLSEMIRALACGYFFQAALKDDLHIGFSHRLAQFPVDDCARAAVEQRAEIEKGPGDVDIGDIDVPVLMRGERLHKAGTFKGGLRLPGLQQPRALEHPVGT